MRLLEEKALERLSTTNALSSSPWLSITHAALPNLCRSCTATWGLYRNSLAIAHLNTISSTILFFVQNRHFHIWSRPKKEKPSLHKKNLLFLKKISRAPPCIDRNCCQTKHLLWVGRLANAPASRSERHFLPETDPNPGQTPPERLFLPESHPNPGQIILAPQKKCISSPKAPPFRDIRPPEGLFLPKSNLIPGQTILAPQKKCTFSPKATPFREKLVTKKRWPGKISGHLKTVMVLKNA